MMVGLLSVAYFLISIFFNLILLVLWMRFTLSYFRVSRLNPVSQSIHQITYFLPAKTKPQQYDYVCLAAIVVVTFLKLLLLTRLAYHHFIPIYWLLLLLLGDLIVQVCDLFFYALLIRVVIQWIAPHWSQNPVASLIFLITAPIVRVCRRLFPKALKFDWAPLVALVGLKALSIFVSSSLALSSL